MMKRHLMLLVTVLALSATMIGCTTVQKSMAVGAGLGAAVGGVWGSNGGGLLNAGEGAAIGAVTGATVGALVGDQMDERDNEALRATIAEKDAEIDRLQQQIASLNTDLASAREQLAAAQRRIAALEQQIADLRAQLAEGGGPRLEITLLSDVLFASGSNQLTANGRQALDNALPQIREHARPGAMIQIEGHTDTDPIRATADRWDDNWDLGAGRAFAVLNYLVSQGISAQNLSAASFGEQQPVASNANAQGKSQNRRAVIAIYSNWPRGEIMDAQQQRLQGRTGVIGNQGGNQDND